MPNSAVFAHHSDHGGDFTTTFININVIDEETQNFPGESVILEVTEVYQGETLDEYSFTLIESNQNITVIWSSNNLPEGTQIYLKAVKDEYITSDSYIFTITDTTPTEGLLFSHTFILKKEVSDVIQTINEETYNFEIYDKQFEIEITSSSEIGYINLNEKLKSLKIIVYETSAAGFLNVSIPINLMNGPFTVILDNILVTSFSENIQNNIVTINLPYSMGEHEILVKSETIIQPEIPPTTIIINKSSDTIYVDEIIKISGQISPPKIKTNISINYTDSTDNTTTRTVATLADGSFEDNFKPDVAGSWQVSAILIENNEQIISSELIFTVNQIQIEPVVEDEVENNGEIEVEDEIKEEEQVKEKAKPQKIPEIEPENNPIKLFNMNLFTIIIILVVLAVSICLLFFILKKRKTKK